VGQGNNRQFRGYLQSLQIDEASFPVDEIKKIPFYLASLCGLISLPVFLLYGCSFRRGRDRTDGKHGDDNSQKNNFRKNYHLYYILADFLGPVHIFQLIINKLSQNKTVLVILE